MAEVTIAGGKPIVKRLCVPGDKSISHRALMFASLADGRSTIEGLQAGLDVRATRQAMEALGVAITEERDRLVVEGRGLGGLAEPDDVIDCMNSGTTIRLLSGIVAGCSFLTVLTGDVHLRKRPMARILDPLREMGTLALGKAEDSRAPVVIRGGSLRRIEWKMPMASAQVKSAILLAGLGARGITWVEEPKPTRDHTERMLASMGVKIHREGANRVGIEGGAKLSPVAMRVPGDPSSAAFWAAAALCVPGSDVTVEHIDLNPTRTGFFRLVERMGAPVEFTQTGEEMGEPVGNVRIRYAPLTGIEVGPDEVPSAIDEFPIFAVLAATAKGETVITGAEELRHKESDRIEAVAGELRKAGAAVTTAPDGMTIAGETKLVPARFASHGDHRLAMSMGILSLAIPGGGVVTEAEAAEVSYPGFWKELLESVE